MMTSPDAGSYYEQQIYDLVAVEYISTDEEGIYSRLLMPLRKCWRGNARPGFSFPAQRCKPAAAPFREHFYSISRRAATVPTRQRIAEGVSNANPGSTSM